MTWTFDTTPAMNDINNMIIEVAIAYPNHPLDTIIAEVLSRDYLKNVQYEQRLVYSPVGLYGALSLLDRAALPKLITAAKARRAAQMKELASQPIKTKLSHKLVDEFGFTQVEALNLVTTHSLKEVKVLLKITPDQVQALKDILQNISMHGLPKTCTTFSETYDEIRSVDEAIAEFKRVLQGHPGTLMVNNGWKRANNPFNYEAKIREIGLTEQHLELISSMSMAALAHGPFRLKGSPYISQYKMPGDTYLGDLKKAMDIAMKELTSVGYTCREIEYDLYDAAAGDSEHYFHSDSWDIVMEKVKRVEAFVEKQKAAKLDPAQTELTVQGQGRRLLAMNEAAGLQSNAASPRYTTPFASAVQLFKAAINSVSATQIQNMLTSAAICAVATIDMQSIARSSFGFFATVANTLAAEPEMSTALTISYR
jgi:hypothetical protein